MKLALNFSVNTDIEICNTDVILYLYFKYINYKIKIFLMIVFRESKIVTVHFMQ